MTGFMVVYLNKARKYHNFLISFYIMHLVFLLLITLSTSYSMAYETADYSILKQYQEDKRGFNLKATWKDFKNADYYKVRVFRITPSPLNTEFNSKSNFFYFKLYPWRLYKWEVQPMDSLGSPLSDPIPGKDIYLESGLYPKPEVDEVTGEMSVENEEEQSFQLQSYVTEDGETDIAESPPVEITPEPSEYVVEEEDGHGDIEKESHNPVVSSESEPESKPWYSEKVRYYQVGLGLGMTSFTFDQSVDTRVDLDFASFKLLSYRLFFNGQWNRWLGNVEYQSLPGVIDSAQNIDGGKDYQWTNLNLQIAYQLFRFNIFGKKSILSPLLGYQMSEVPFIYVDTTDGLNRKAPTLSVIKVGVHTETQWSENWSIPIGVSYLYPVSASGDGGSFEISSGNGLQITAALQWQLSENWITAFQSSIERYDLQFKSNIANDQQTGSLFDNIMNNELQLIYQF